MVDCKRMLTRISIDNPEWAFVIDLDAGVFVVFTQYGNPAPRVLGVYARLDQTALERGGVKVEGLPVAYVVSLSKLLRMTPEEAADTLETLEDHLSQVQQGLDAVTDMVYGDTFRIGEAILQFSM
ncbi:hypothetical protein KIPB_011319 [Kipferlia bialata]|uniref:Uncharacterized protein n=1 Tax=Kipferlia bialata TaxID=797122 RepID=A0A9K3D7D0_9EUKA|nr:hypothetical protein KIPB_011319 [Kipferlia bialata]|eukprot:g11319.t1